MRKYIYLLLMPLLLVLFACEEKEFLEFSKSQAVITFEGFPAFSGTFTTLDEVVVPVSAEGASSLDVIALVDGVETPFALSASSSSLTIQESWSDLLGGPAISSIGGDDITLRVTALANGESSFKDFTVSSSNPLSLDFGDSETASTQFPDSTFNIFYNVNTVNATVARVEFFAKIGSDSEYPATPFATETINATSAAELTMSFPYPAEDSIDFGDELFVRAVVVGANDLTDNIEIGVESVEVPLDDEGSFVLFPDDFVIAAATDETPTVFDEENNGFDFSEATLVADASDSADIRLGVDMGNLVLTLDAGVEYVIADGNDAVNGFQSARDLFAAGAADDTEIVNLSQLKDNANGFIILSIPDLASFGTGSSEYVILRIESVNINTAIVDEDVDAINNSTVTLSYEGRLP